MVAIDLGSNSIRFLKMACATRAFVGEFHKTVKTADGLAQTGLIGEGAIERIVNAIHEAKAVIDFSDATIKAVTTEAIRRAKNGEEILDRIAEQTGVRFEIIDGEAEARYALIAVQNRLQLLGREPNSFMLIDIGGGSTELIFHYGDTTIDRSFQLGIVTLTQRFGELEAIRDAIPEVMQPVKAFCDEVYARYGEVEMFIATAGTPTTIAAMKHGMTYNTYDPEKIHGTVLTLEDLQNQLVQLLAMEVEKRIEIVGVGRDDLIASGVLIYEELYRIGGFTESMVVDDGVREGVAFDECEKSKVLTFEKQ
ncbi:MAG: phosphatase [Campylobacterales bacterium]|nr:phosphatase [Campylobacterales bacterium]